jgi:hypothetical protein
VPEERFQLVLEVGEGVHVIEEDREYRLDDDAIAAEFDASRQCRLDPMRPRHDGVIVVLSDEHRDLRKVTERVGILLSAASAERVEAVGRYLPIRSDQGATA